MTTITAIAPAKLNLFLHITGKRSDGYHLIESQVVFTEFGDTLSFESAGPLTFAIDGPFSEPLLDDAHQNLVMRAASELRFRSGCAEGAKILLTKNIPLGAGLGGGSSDAAATIENLCRLWKIWGIDDTKHKMALSLGADVKMCLKPQPCFVQGIGEKISPLPILFPFWAVLVNPNQPLPTAEVYKQFGEQYDAPVKCPERFSNFEELAAFLNTKRNALEPAALGKVPVIAEILHALGSTAGCRIARMTGSGATCFGLYASEEEARSAADSIRATFPAWWATHSKIQQVA